MRILIVGSESRYAIEKPYMKYLSQLEQVTKVEIFAAQNIFLGYYQKDLLNKVLYRAGLSRILRKINSQLKARIVDWRPDIVFVFKGMEIYPETLKWIRGRQIKLVNYNPDNPFIFSGKGSGNNNLRSSIPLYDLHLTYNKAVKEEIEDTYAIPARILPFGFDISDDTYNACVKETEIMRTCFLGNPDKYRSLFITELAQSGIEIDVYGNSWGKFVDHKNIKVHDVVYEDEFWRTLRKYRVQLNLMRPHNPDAHNMRTFEVPGIGGIQLAPVTVDHQTYFDPGREIFLFKNNLECQVEIAALLALRTDAANNIRESARTRSLRSCYSYKDRAKEVSNYFQEFFA